MAALKKVFDPNIKLLRVVEILTRKILWTEKWNELSIHSQGWIRTQVRGNLLGLILQNHSSRGLQRMVVRQRQINGLVESDSRRILPATRPHEQKEQYYSCEHPKMSGAHKGLKSRD